MPKKRISKIESKYRGTKSFSNSARNNRQAQIKINPPPRPIKKDK